MNANPPSDPCQRALKQYTALLFNRESGRLQNVCTVDLSAQGCTSTNVGELVGELAGLIQSQDGDNCRVATACADAVNTGNGLTEAEVVAVVSIAIKAPVSEAEPIVRPGRSPGGRTADTVEPASRPAESQASRVLVGIMATTANGGIELPAEAPTPRPEAGATSIRRHLAVLANAAAPQRARDASIDALLTVLSGGYDVEVRLSVVRALIPQVDAGLESLLVRHLEDIRDEAMELGNLERSGEAERLLAQLAQ